MELNFMQCTMCYALVLDINAHVQWHEREAEINEHVTLLEMRIRELENG